VVLLERERGASSKLCGEFLSAGGVRVLDRLGALPAVLDAGALSIPAWTVASARTEFRRTLRAPGLAIARSRLDPLLRGVARAAGARVREGTRVAAIERSGAGTFRVRTVEETGPDEEARREVVEARGIVVAFGRAGRVNGLDDGVRPEEFVAMKAHVNESVGGDARVALYALRGGYVGVVPAAPGTSNVCFIARREVFRRSGSGPGFLDDGARSSGVWRERWRGVDASAARWIAVSSMTFGRRRPVGPGVLYAGDAAALIAPLLGDGMAMALESGVLAAGAISRILGGAPEERAIAEYHAEWRRRFSRRLALGRSLQAILLRPRMSGLAVRILETVPVLGDWVSDRSP
jgi:flavin-dependent dehydrogenase